MEMDWLPAVIGGVAGLGTGAIGSIVAPWVQWGFEKKRLDRERRIEQVQPWRDGIKDIADQLYYRPNEDLDAYYAREIRLERAYDVKSHHWYATLEPHLNDDLRIYCEVEPASHSPFDRGAEMVQRLTKEVARVERDYV